MLEDPMVLIVNSGIASHLNYPILRHPGFGWPPQLHDEGTIPSAIISIMALPPLGTSRSNHTSPTTNDAMLEEDHTTQFKTSPILTAYFTIIVTFKHNFVKKTFFANG
jgi:hypothetical protein